jgi:hypothetical protein
MSNDQDILQLRRRAFLGQSTGLGLGALFASLLANSAQASPRESATAQLHDQLRHHVPRAKRIIFLTQSGGPSQIELFDYKPNLRQIAGQELPESVRGGQRLTGMTEGKPQLIMPPHTRFARYGESGATVGEWLPHTAEVVDELCFVKSMVTDQINHAPAMTKFLSGHHLVGRPSLGSWLSYGLGSDNRDLPDYLVLISKMLRGSDQPLYDSYWGSGFLPSVYQGVKLRSAREPVLYVRDPDGMSRELRRTMLDDLRQLNHMRYEATLDPEIITRIEQYEMAFRMQASVPELTDLSDEPESVFELYGADSRRPGSYAANCILARRLSERGVRFVQLFHPDWDHHSRLRSWCTARCRDTDQASAALVIDLKRRGLLDETLVIWGGEFGRSVAGQGDWNSPEGGRDHHPRCFTIWLAGGGVKPGVTYGATDDFSYNVAENPVQVRDLHATILHLLGIDHSRFSYRSQGLDFRLTGVEPARVVEDLLA